MMSTVDRHASLIAQGYTKDNIFDFELRRKIRSETMTIADAGHPEREYIWELPSPPREFEPFNRYHAGGLHPVHFTEIYSRYRILDKLGFGSSSHVWLAEDISLAQPLANPLALKFIVAAATERTIEIEIHQFLSSLPSSDVGSRNILPLLDTFRVEGPNGLHNVIVSDAVAFIPDLCKWKIFEDLNEAEIIRQLFQGVSFLHAHGVVHRDLHCGNIGIEIPHFRNAGIEDLIESDDPIIFPCILCEPVVHPPHLPKYVVQNCPALSSNRHFYEDTSALVVKLVDFGCAFRPGTGDVLPDGGPRRTLTAPECIVSAVHLPQPVPEETWTFKSDIWTLGCTLVELYSRSPGQSLFSNSSSSSLGAEMAKYLGPVPDPYRCILDDNATLHHSDCHPPSSGPDDSGDYNAISANWMRLEASLVAARAPRLPLSPEDEEVRVQRDAEDVHKFLSLIKQMLRWNAEDRIQATEALSSPFLADS